MTNKERKKRADARFEIRVRKLALKRLAVPLKQAIAAGEKARAVRIERLQKLSDYKSFDEAQEAYGYGAITEQEFDAICASLERQEELKEERSAEECAAEILHEFIQRLTREIAHFEFELLPQEEREKILKRNLESEERRKQRQIGGSSGN